MKFEMRGFFEYQDPHEPIGFEFDKKTVERMDKLFSKEGGEVWSLSDLIDEIEPGVDKWYRKEKKFYKMTLEVED